jgi:hypothetical protein
MGRTLAAAAAGFVSGAGTIVLLANVLNWW